jgi:hypothetical protein
MSYDTDTVLNAVKINNNRLTASNEIEGYQIVTQ